MKKIRITEKQAAIILKRDEDLAKKKVLKINEGQYKRLFRNEGIAFSNEVEEPEKKEIDPLEFAQQLIIFVRDIIKGKPRPFSNYWKELDITRAQLIKILKDNEVFETVMDEGTGRNAIKARKTGFRRAVKTIYKDVVAKRDTIGIDELKTPYTGWSSGDDPRDEPMTPRALKVPVNKRVFGFIDYFDSANHLLLVNDANKQLYAISSEDMENELEVLNDHSDYDLEQDGIVDGDAIFEYLNYEFRRGNLEDITSDVDKLWAGYLVRVNQEIKQALLETYNEPELEDALNSAVIPEMASAGASADGGSSGPYVGGMSGGSVIKKDTGYSPGESMRGISDVKPEMIVDGELNESGIDPTYTHFAIFKVDGKIADGWEYEGVDKDEINYYSKIDLGDNYPDHKLSEFKLVTKEFLIKQGIDPFDSNNWYKIQGLGETMSMGGSSGINAGRGGNSIEYDVNAFGESEFMQAGNKLNKEETMPMIKRPGIHEAIKTGQYYKDDSGNRLKVGDFNTPYFDIEINGKPSKQTPEELSARNWVLISESRKMLKVTESQMKRIMEATNKDSTAYPGGGFVELDDCTKLNNNTEAQDGGCSQGAVDNVVNLKKTKDSVVSKG